MVVRVRLFAMLRERAGRDMVELELPRGARVDEALAALGEVPALAELLERMPLRMAVNRDYAAGETVLHAGDELALIPPVSGGSVNAAGRVTAQALSRERLADEVASPAAGAVVIFEGRTREVERLEYEAYAEMAAERIGTIMREVAERHCLCGAVAEHRTGEVPLGEPSVIVAVSAPHREEAFAAAREAIDRIKAEAPIWKREHGKDEAPRWVPGSVPEAGGR
jgi:molybdopterin synthase catalytic subunit